MCLRQEEGIKYKQIGYSDQLKSKIDPISRLSGYSLNEIIIKHLSDLTFR